MATAILTVSGRVTPDVRGGAVGVGNFDGVHLGHAALVRELRRQADAVGGPAVAVSFDPHPLALLAPEKLKPLLTAPRDRADLLHAAGADHVVLLHTTPELLALDATTFLDRVVGGILGAKALVEGFNFRFGRDRGGSTDSLADWCRTSGRELTVVPPFPDATTPISSSRVREALDGGDVSAATALLGRHYRLRGIVGMGDRRGRTLGFPTANLVEPTSLVPGDGVYAARATLDDGFTWPAAVNVGPNPTFGVEARKVEAFLIGFAGDLYGQSLSLDFVERLRGTRPFAGIAELIGQLKSDVEQAKRILGATEGKR